jgi:hypothetical protein
MYTLISTFRTYPLDHIHQKKKIAAKIFASVNRPEEMVKVVTSRIMRCSISCDVI